MILIPLNKVLLTVAVALVATATLIEACGEDPNAMTGCELMASMGRGKPRGEKAKMMVSSVQNIGCQLPQWTGPKPKARGEARPEDKANFMQGNSERLIPDRYTSYLAYRREKTYA